jgi:hypothetical protein
MKMSTQISGWYIHIVLSCGEAKADFLEMMDGNTGNCYLPFRHMHWWLENDQ